MQGWGAVILVIPKRKGVFFLKKTPDKNKKIDQVVEEIKFLSLFWPRVWTKLSKQLKIEMNDVSRKHEDDQLIMQHSI